MEASSKTHTKSALEGPGPAFLRVPPAPSAPPAPLTRNHSHAPVPPCGAVCRIMYVSDVIHVQEPKLVCELIRAALTMHREALQNLAFVVDVAADGFEVLNSVGNSQYNVIVLKDNLKGMSLAETVCLLRVFEPDAKIVVVPEPSGLTHSRTCAAAAADTIESSGGATELFETPPSPRRQRVTGASSTKSPGEPFGLHHPHHHSHLGSGAARAVEDKCVTEGRQFAQLCRMTEAFNSIEADPQRSIVDLVVSELEDPFDFVSIIQRLQAIDASTSKKPEESNLPLLPILTSGDRAAEAEAPPAGHSECTIVGPNVKRATNTTPGPGPLAMEERLATMRTTVAPLHTQAEGKTDTPQQWQDQSRRTTTPCSTSSSKALVVDAEVPCLQQDFAMGQQLQQKQYPACAFGPVVGQTQGQNHGGSCAAYPHSCRYSNQAHPPCPATNMVEVTRISGVESAGSGVQQQQLQATLVT